MDSQNPKPQIMSDCLNNVVSTQHQKAVTLSFDPWSVVEEKYTLKESIGVGSFGEVVRARCLKTKSNVAIKHISVDLCN